jgi:hypothetical protein
MTSGWRRSRPSAPTSCWRRRSPASTTPSPTPRRGWTACWRRPSAPGRRRRAAGAGRRAQGRLRSLHQDRRDPGLAAGSQGPVGRRGHGRRLCRPGRAGAADPAPPPGVQPDARHLPGAHHRLGHVPQAGLDRRPGRQLGGRDRLASGDHGSHPGRDRLPGRRALRQPGRHPGPARRRLCRYRRVAGRGGAGRLRRPGDLGLHLGRRGQQAQGPAGLHRRRRRLGDLGPGRLPGHRRGGRLAGQRTRPTS